MMIRLVYILLIILIFNAQVRPVLAGEDDDDDAEDTEDGPTAATKHTTKLQATNNAKTATTTKPVISKVSSPAITTKSKLPNQIFLNQSTSSTTEDPFATATYSPAQNNFDFEERTACKPVCLPFKCETDPTMFNANGTRIVPSAIGKLKFVCRKFYIFSKIEVSWTRAQEFCCAFNMRLLNIESYAQFKCLKSLNHDSGAHYKIGGNVYWTAGSDENCEGTFGWCDIDAPFSKWIPWLSGQPSNGDGPSNIGGENCATFEHTTGVMRSDLNTRFGDRLCESKAQFICELFYKKATKRGECKEPICLPYVCKIEPKFVGISGEMEVPIRLGKFANICNKNYFFGRLEVTWGEAQEFCCAINMRLLNLKQEQDLKCLKTIGTNYGVHSKFSYNSYWIALSDQGCEGKFTWCGTGEPMQDWKEWSNASPDGGTGENCILFFYDVSPLNKLPLNFRVDDRNCNTKIHFICEESRKNNSEVIASIVKNKITNAIAQKKSQLLQVKYKGQLLRKNKKDLNGWNISNSSAMKPGCLYPRCPRYDCVVNFKYLELNEAFTVPPETGVLKTVCGKQFLFSRDETTWSGAQELCCSLDMRLYNVESAEQMTCIRDLNIESGLHYHMGVVSYWTGGSDQGCEAKFGWCNSRRLLDKWIAWAKGAPKNANGNENCLALDYVVHFSKSEQASNFTDANCELKKKFICESL